MLTVSTRQPSPEPVESLAIRHRILVFGRLKGRHVHDSRDEAT